MRLYPNTKKAGVISYQPAFLIFFLSVQSIDLEEVLIY